MKDVLRSAAMAFQMFSVVPMPRVEWKKKTCATCSAACRWWA